CEPGLLRALFLAGNSPEAAHYFVGYLWIKAAASTLARQCPKLARPALLYPLLTKLIFDSEAILECFYDGPASAFKVDDLVMRLTSVFKNGGLARLHKARPATLDKT